MGSLNERIKFELVEDPDPGDSHARPSGYEQASRLQREAEQERARLLCPRGPHAAHRLKGGVTWEH